jgi:hypothetical protein
MNAPNQALGLEFVEIAPRRCVGHAEGDTELVEAHPAASLHDRANPLPPLGRQITRGRSVVANVALWVCHERILS